MSLFFGVFSSYNGNLIGDYSARVTSLEFGTNEHGFAELAAFVPMTLSEAFQLYDRPGLPHVLVSDNGATVWEGRLEDVAIVNGGVRFGAFGYWRALSDAPVTRLWSKTKVDEWRPTPESVGGYAPQMYEMDNNNRLFIGLAKSASYKANANVGGWYYEIPHNAPDDFSWFSFDYAYDLPTNWAFNQTSYRYGFISGSDNELDRKS